MSHRPLARNSLSVAQWTLVSRLTGFARIVTVAAVLGPTYLGNTYQATNLVPNLVFEMLTGSLLATLLVPSLVALVDGGDARAVQRVAGGFLGFALAVIGVVTAAAVVLSPVVVGALSATADAAVAADQRRVGTLLLLMFLPQVALYATAGICGAVMNAHGRFALAAGAPALENLGVMATMGVTLAWFGSGTAIADVETAQLVVLGAGTTAAVGLHAAAQWLGVRRCGVTLLPRGGWRDPDVRLLIRRARPSLGYAGLNALRVFAGTIVANRVPGGVVAYHLALNFFHLPTAVGARPLAIALLPRLARLKESRALERLRDEYVLGLGRVVFLSIPAAVAYVALAVPLARAASFGELATETGVDLLAAALTGLGLGVLGEGVFVMSTHASYALGNTRLPFRAMIVRTVVSLTGMVAVIATVDGPLLLALLGLSIAGGDVVAAAYLARSVARKLPHGRQRLAPAALRSLGASSIMIVPAYLVATILSGGAGGDPRSVVAMLAAGAVGVATFVGVQRIWRSPELEFFTSGLPRRRLGGVR